MMMFNLELLGAAGDDIGEKLSGLVREHTVLTRCYKVVKGSGSRETSLALEPGLRRVSFAPHT